jgi:hypothetical protein
MANNFANILNPIIKMFFHLNLYFLVLWNFFTRSTVYAHTISIYHNIQNTNFYRQTAKWSAYQIPSVIIVFVILVFKV